MTDTGLMERASLMGAWNDLCDVEAQCFGDHLTLGTVAPILRKFQAPDTDALNAIVIILAALRGGADRHELFYEIGRALGTAQVALGSRLSPQAQTALEQSRELALTGQTGR